MKQFYCTLVLALAPMTTAVSAQQIDTRHYIYIEASASVQAKADTTTVPIYISAKADTNQAAIDEAIEQSNALMAAIAELGVPSTDVETISFQFEKVYIIAKDAEGKPVASWPDPDRDQFDGYRASNNLSVTVGDFAKVGSILSVAARLGAGVGSLDFSASRREDYLLEAKQKATEAALEKAQLYARGLGAELGTLLVVREGTGYDPETMEYPSREGEMADLAILENAPAVPVSPPTLDFNASLSVKWEITGRQPGA